MYTQSVIFTTWFVLFQVLTLLISQKLTSEILPVIAFVNLEADSLESDLEATDSLINQELLSLDSTKRGREGLAVQSLNKILTFDVSFENQLTYFYDHQSLSLYSLDFEGEYRFVAQLPKFSDELQNLHVFENGREILFWDRGLGTVHKFDLRTNTLNRLDRSFSFRSFYDHGAWVNEIDEKITAMGGYGLFQKKNLLLQFDTKLQEWLSPNVTGDLPTPGKGRLIYLEDRNSYLFIVLNDNDQSKTHLEVEVFEFLLESNKWIEKGFFSVSKRSRLVTHHLINQIGNKRLDPVNGIFSVDSGLFYDIQKNRFYDTDITAKKDERIGTVSYFFSGVPDKWLVLSRNNTQEITYSSEFISLNSLFELESTEIVYASKTIPLWILLTAGLLTLFISGLLAKKKFFTQESSLSTRVFTLKLDNETPRLCIHGKWQSVVDPSEIRFWKFTHDKLISSNNRIDLKYFDESIFLGEMHASQLSKKRNAFINSINKKVGVQFVLLEKSQIDKRYKELVFIEDMINIDS